MRVLDCFTIQPMDTKTVEKALRETRAVVTVEEHSTRGGLGEAVSHIAAELRGSAPMRLLGLPEEVVIGKSQELFAYYGLTPKGLALQSKNGWSVNRMSYILAIDQSTAGTKAVLFNKYGAVISRSDLPHRQIVDERGGSSTIQSRLLQMSTRQQNRLSSRLISCRKKLRQLV